MAQLLDERDLGVLTSSTSLLVALVSNNHEAYWSCLPKCVKILERLARNQDIPQEYTYYGIPSPWLQVSIYMLYLAVFWREKKRGRERFISRLITYDPIYPVLLNFLNVSSQQFLHHSLQVHAQVKAMRALQYFPTIEDPNIRRSLFEV